MNTKDLRPSQIRTLRDCVEFRLAELQYAIDRSRHHDLVGMGCYSLEEAAQRVTDLKGLLEVLR